MNNTAILGYTPLSAVNRTIKDGSRFDKLFPKPDNKKTLLKRDGEVDETVQFMKQIVNDNNYQTEGIAEYLAIYNNDGSINQYESVKKLWQFVVDYIKYNIEAGEQLRTPAKTWFDAQVCARRNPSANDPKYSADCDCMSIFCGCVLLNWGIPFSFRITGYSDVLGICHGYQHVYTIAHCTGENVICDPVYHKFNEEKTFEIQKTIPMSLNGCDIYALSGLPEDVEDMNVYVEQSDGGLGILGTLNGRAKRKKRREERKKKKKARKEAKKEKKAAKKEKRKAKKDMRKAKKSGNKQAYNEAKQRKLAAKDKIAEAKDKIDANRTGIAKAMSSAVKVIKKGTMFAVRAPFLLLLRLNFRGMATGFSRNPEALRRFKVKWRRIFGGSEKKLMKAIEKGKNKKALFGKGKALKGLGALEDELRNLGSVLEKYGVITQDTVEGLGFTDGGVSEAIALASSVVSLAMGIFEGVKAALPNNKEEAEAQGYEAEEVDEDTQVSYTEDDMDYNEGEEENDEELEGLYKDFYFVDGDKLYHRNLDGTIGELNGKKRKARKEKRKAKKAARKEKRKAKKQAKKQAKKMGLSKKEARKFVKDAKKKAKKEFKEKKKQIKQQFKETKKQIKAEKKNKGNDDAVIVDPENVEAQTNYDTEQIVQVDNTTPSVSVSDSGTIYNANFDNVTEQSYPNVLPPTWMDEMEDSGLKTETIEISDEMAQKIAKVAVDTKLKNEDSGDEEDADDAEDYDKEELSTKTSTSTSTTRGKTTTKKGVNKKVVYAGLAVLAACGVGFAIYKSRKGGK